MAIQALAVAGVAGQAGGSILQGFYGRQQKKNEAAIAQYNSFIMRNQAKAVRMRTKFQQERAAEESARIERELRASIGGSGIVSTQGAPLLALALQKSEADLENYLIGYEGRLEAEQLENRALEFGMQRTMLKIGARQAAVGGFLGAGSSVMSEWSSMFPPKPPLPPSASATGSGYYGGTGGGGPTGGASRSMIG